MYARMLGLRYVTPSGFLCFVFLEGAVALGFLLALAELVNWWGVLVLPLTVAAMVKLNDVVAGVLTQPVAGGPAVAGGSEFAIDDMALSRARTVDLRMPGRAGDPRGGGRAGAARGSRSGDPRRSRPGDARGGGRPGDPRRNRPGDAGSGGRPGDPSGGERTVELRGADRTVDLRPPKQPVAGARAIDGAAVARTLADDLDLREQRARQSAARRYE
jgi:hypothetical protein